MPRRELTPADTPMASDPAVLTRQQRVERWLLSGRPGGLEAFAAKLGVSARTVRRDCRAIAKAWAAQTADVEAERQRLLAESRADADAAAVRALQAGHPLVWTALARLRLACRAEQAKLLALPEYALAGLDARWCAAVQRHVPDTAMRQAILDDVEAAERVGPLPALPSGGS
jgi:hypothetical protein